MEVETITVEEVAKALHTAPMKVKSAIKNHTMPIGAVLQTEGSGVERTIVSKTRWVKWLAGEM